jgi:hypothetical protein
MVDQHPVKYTWTDNDLLHFTGDRIQWPQEWQKHAKITLEIQQSKNGRKNVTVCLKLFGIQQKVLDLQKLLH